MVQAAPLVTRRSNTPCEMVAAFIDRHHPAAGVGCRANAVSRNLLSTRTNGISFRRYIFLAIRTPMNYKACKGALPALCPGDLVGSPPIADVGEQQLVQRLVTQAVVAQLGRGRGFEPDRPASARLGHLTIPWQHVLGRSNLDRELAIEEPANPGRQLVDVWRHVGLQRDALLRPRDWR